MSSKTDRKRHLIARACFQEAFDALGGVPALVRWARANPTDFYKLYAHKLIPTPVAPLTLEGEEDENGMPISIQVVFRDARPVGISPRPVMLEQPRLPERFSTLTGTFHETDIERSA